MKANNFLSGLTVESSRRIAAGYGSASVDLPKNDTPKVLLSQLMNSGLSSAFQKSTAIEIRYDGQK